MSETLGEKIKSLRVQKGFTQSDLASGLVTPSMISQIESDKAQPSHKLLTAIAEKLETPIEYFLSDVQMLSEQTSKFKMARAMFEAGEHSSALAIFEELSNETMPRINSMEIQISIAKCQARIGKFDESLSSLEQILDSALLRKDDHIQVSALRELSILHTKKGNFPVALHYLDQMIEVMNRSDSFDAFSKAEAFYLAGEIYESLRERDKAENSYESGGKLVSEKLNLRDIVESYRMSGNTLHLSGNFEHASDLFSRSISLHQMLNDLDTALSLKIKIAVSSSQNGEDELALKTLSECLYDCEKYEQYEGVAKVHLEMARIYAKTGNFEDAKLSCDDAMSAIPDNHLLSGEVFMIYSQISKSKGETDESILYLQKAISAFESADASRQLVDAYTTLAQNYKDAGNFEKALEVFEKSKKAMETHAKKHGVFL